MKRLVFDSLVDRENICNQKPAIDRLRHLLNDGRKVILYGRRNRAKTSIIRNVSIVDWQAQHPGGLAIYTELMHARSMEDISERFTKSFKSEYQKRAKVSSFLESTMELLKGLSPTYSLSDDGRMEFGMTVNGNKNIPVDTLLDRIAKIHRSGKPCLLCFDEFQDIAGIAGAEALLRRKFEELPADLPIVCLGSKRHILADIFLKQDAPFAGWGDGIELQDIPYDEYNTYLKERLSARMRQSPEDTLVYLQDRLLRSPEAIHRICFEANTRFGRDTLSSQMIDQLIEEYVRGKSSYFEAKISTLSVHQISFLKAIAHSPHASLAGIYSKDFLVKIDMTAGGLRKTVRRLLDLGEIDSADGKSYQMTDPFLMIYLELTRLSL